MNTVTVATTEFPTVRHNSCRCTQWVLHVQLTCWSKSMIATEPSTFITNCHLLHMSDEQIFLLRKVYLKAGANCMPARGYSWEIVRPGFKWWKCVRLIHAASKCLKNGGFSNIVHAPMLDSIDVIGTPASIRMDMSSTNCFVTPVLCHKRNGTSHGGIQFMILGSCPRISWPWEHLYTLDTSRTILLEVCIFLGCVLSEVPCCHLEGDNCILCIPEEAQTGHCTSSVSKFWYCSRGDQSNISGHKTAMESFAAVMIGAIGVGGPVIIIVGAWKFWVAESIAIFHTSGKGFTCELIPEDKLRINSNDSVLISSSVILALVARYSTDSSYIELTHACTN